MDTIERRKVDRRAGQARAERNYAAARRRILALEKALDLMIGSLAAGGYAVDPQRMGRYRQGVDVARALLGEKLPVD